MNWIKSLGRHLAARFSVIFACERFERIYGAVECRGQIYIITDSRLLRYDPERDEVQVEHFLRRM